MQSTLSSLKDLPAHFRRPELTQEEQETINVSAEMALSMPSSCLPPDMSLARGCLRSSETEAKEVRAGNKRHGNKDVDVFNMS